MLLSAHIEYGVAIYKLSAKESNCLADSEIYIERLSRVGKLMHNNIGGSNFLSSDGYDLLRMKSGGHHYGHEKDMSPKMDGDAFAGNVSFYSAKSEFYVASVNKDGGYKILAQSLSVEFSSATGETASVFLQEASSSFRPPSPLDVANKVLGFVENRLNAERESGADSDRISNLISQAREGVQKGFSQARDDIESLGLMTEKLDKDIERGFDRIDSGLTEMEGRLGGVEQGEYVEAAATQSADQSIEQPIDQPIDQTAGPSVAQLIEPQVDPSAVSTKGVNVSGAQAYQESATYSGDVIEGGDVSSRFTYQNSSEFSLKTQDGDTITIRYADAGAEVFESAGNKLLLGQSQFQGYQLEVDGELDEGELAAIADLFSQLGEVSSLFFGGSFQDAFASALEVGFDASEIASFSLDLSKVQTQEVRTYSNPGNVYEQGSGDLGAIQKNQPLIEMVELFEKSIELLKAFDGQQFDFREFISESISMAAVEKDVSTMVSQNDFSDFTEKMLELLTE